MNIRKSKISDFDDILHIYAYAREQMKKNGNPSQWGDREPSREKVLKDIRDNFSYVIETGGKICGVFALIPGEEPTYRIIEGSWLNNMPYGTVHRVASDGSSKGILKTCLDFCEKQMGNIRIDTHTDNKIMHHLLSAHGYTKCGVIHVEDGSPRIAYQKCTIKTIKEMGYKS